MTKPRRYAHSLQNDQLREQYVKAGFAGRVGWGRKPALLVIDLAQTWASPDARLGSDLSDVVSSVGSLLAIARSRAVPIIFTTMAYEGADLDPNTVLARKLPHTADLMGGGRGSELVPELKRRPAEPIVCKPRSSAFFETPLRDMLHDDGVDTTVIVGCSTSGCIRATCESAFNYNFHAIVPAQAVGDRSASAHQTSLFDIDARFADVCALSEVAAMLAGGVTDA